MNIDLAALPDDVETLQKLARSLAAERTSLREAQAEIERLNIIIKKLQRSQFGCRSERLDDDQLQLGFEDLKADLARTEAILPSARARTARTQEERPSLPAHLSREDVRFDVESQACPCCGGALHLIGETVSEMLDHVPARLRVIRICRPRYGCRACGTIHQAPAPERPIARGWATPALLAHVLVSKYCDSLASLQAKPDSSPGRAPRSTAPPWRTGLAAPAGGSSRCRKGSPSTSLHRKSCLPTTPRSRCWILAGAAPRPVGYGSTPGMTGPGRALIPPAAVYLYSPDRKAERPASHLAGFSGILQVDGYPGFDRLGKGGIIRLAGCWAHARRKFYEVQQATASPVAAEALQRIAELYAIETTIRGQTAAARLGVRQAKSLPLVASMKAWLEKQFAQIPPRGGLADAIRYTLSRWTALCCFLNDGRVELDTNAVERAIRPVTLGRKNHLFAGSDGGANRWATVCSLITTAKLNDVEPFAYLTDVLKRMSSGYPASRLDDLLPWNWRRIGCPQLTPCARNGRLRLQIPRKRPFLGHFS